LQVAAGAFKRTVGDRPDGHLAILPQCGPPKGLNAR
jgi:hypothetical protein